MLRTALTPRWLGLLAVVVLVMVTFGYLGAWQLNVARNKGRNAAIAAAPHRPLAPVSTVVTPHGAFPADGSGRLVQASGRYDPSGQVVVTPRLLDGQRGRWVVTPLVETSSGARLAVVRGFVQDGVAVPAPPTTPVTVTGSLEGSESPSSDASISTLPAGELSSVDLAALVNRWPGAAYNAFVLATAERPAGAAVALAAGATSGLQRVPAPVEKPGGLAWRNAAYALQWWIFAGFALYMWAKMVREESDRTTPQARPREALRV